MFVYGLMQTVISLNPFLILVIFLELEIVILSNQNIHIPFLKYVCKKVRNLKNIW